jgi:capsid protein
MNGLIPRIREWLFGAPEDAAPQAAPPSPRQLRGTYDLARTDSSNANQWRGADWLDADASDSPGVRQVLRNRSRHEVQNNPTLTGICRTVCDYEVGTGPTLHVDNDDEDFAAEVEEKWRDWCEAVNLVGKLRQMVYGRVVDGEGFARIGQNPNLKNDVQLDVQPFECDRCYTLWLPYLTPYRIDGIWFDVWGNPTYYDILQYHPGGVFPMPTWKFDTTPAQFVLHLFNPERANQHRGIPEMMSSTDLWADRRRHRKATVAAAESAANVAAFLTTNQPPEEGGALPGGQMEMPRNSLVIAPDGYDMRQIDAKHPNQTYEMFSTETLSEAARPMSMAKNVAKCDSSSYNFAGGRLDIITSWKAVEGNQRNNTWRVVNPLFRAWYVEARLVYGWAAKDSGLVPAHHFLWVGMPYSDPEAEENADEAAIRTGLKGIQEVYARRGKDWRVQRKMNAKALGMSDDEYMDFVVDNLRGGKGAATKEPAEPGETPAQSGETPEAVKAKFARLFPGLAKRLNGHLKAAGWDESKHPRGNKDNPGEFGPGGNTATKTKTSTKPARPGAKQPAAAADIHESPDRPVKLTKVSQRAFTGEPIATKTQLGKSTTGKLGENIIIQYCRQIKGKKDARHLNLDRNNFPIDLVQDHESIEVKAGLVSNRSDAQRWRLTIGEPGKKEKEWLAQASEKQKAAWNSRKQQAIIERKAKCLKNLSKELGKPVKAKTMTVIINPDTKTADIYEFDGWHERIGWKSEEAKAAYVGSVKYE